MLTAQAWENADGLPSEIMAAFNAAPDDYFGNLELVLAIPEYKISLQGGARPSQSDIFALLTSGKGLISMTVEGKAMGGLWPDTHPVAIQSFGERVSSKVKPSHGESRSPRDGPRSYSLSTASPGRLGCNRGEEISRHGSSHGGAILCSVGPGKSFWGTTANFVQLHGKTPVKGSVILLKKIDRIRLYSGWVYTEPSRDTAIKLVL